MKREFKIFLMSIIILFTINSAKSEIIENKKISNQKFGVWTVSCEEDIMFDKVECKLFANVLEETSLLVNPANKNNTIVIISKDIIPNSTMLIKVDKNDVIETNQFMNNQFNLVDMSIENKKTLFEELQKGNNLFFRFTTKDLAKNGGVKEVTVKLNLTEFKKALLYFESKSGIKKEEKKAESTAKVEVKQEAKKNVQKTTNKKTGNKLEVKKTNKTAVKKEVKNTK